MKTSDFSFELPEELIAQHPPKERGSSRLMVVDPRLLDAAGGIEHRMIADLPELVEPGSVIVVNNSKVRRARLFARTDAGGRVEVLLVSPLPEGRWKAMVSRSRKQRIGKLLHFDDGVTGRIDAVDDELRVVAFDRAIDDAWLERFGHVPLPPYIDREDETMDADRYQTVYAESTGSVAAPTAGLHLTETLMQRMRARGVRIATVTLHVGLGTFLPIRTESVEQHKMHEESYEVSEETARLVNEAHAEGRTVLAVGTTSMRTLESAWKGGVLQPGRDSTSLYIYPGYDFRVVDALLTNFHTPGSTLLVLVSAFAGRTLVRRAYEEAVRRRYRFFSYGDAMLIRSRTRGQDVATEEQAQ